MKKGHNGAKRVQKGLKRKYRNECEKERKQYKEKLETQIKGLRNKGEIWRFLPKQKRGREKGDEHVG